MTSRPDETPDQDLAHIIQYTQLASMLVCNARKFVMPTKRRVTLTIQEESELLDYLNGIEERAKAATKKLREPDLQRRAVASRGALTPGDVAAVDAEAAADRGVPNEYLAGSGVSKLLRYYTCMKCEQRHFEDERKLYDAHITAQSIEGIQFGHRTELGLVP